MYIYIYVGYDIYIYIYIDIYIYRIGCIYGVSKGVMEDPTQMDDEEVPVF